MRRLTQSEIMRNRERAWGPTPADMSTEPGVAYDDAPRLDQLTPQDAPTIPSSLPQTQGAWTPERVGSLFSAIHTMPDAPPEIVKLVDAAHELYQGGAPSLPTELTGVLDILATEMPQFGAPDAAAMPDVFVPPIVPEGLPQYYGYTEEEWRSLDTWQRTMARALGTGSVGEKVGSFLGQAMDQYPALETAFNALDVLARGVKRSLGTVALGIEAAKPGGMTFNDFLTNIDDAWTAAEQTYRVMPTSFIAQAQGEPMQAWDFGTTIEREIPQEQVGVSALVEFMERLNAGEKPEDLNAEFEQRYGAQGMLRDMAGMIVLDPLNVIGTAFAKVAGTGLSAGLKSAGVAEDVAKPLVTAVKTADGPINAVKRLRATAEMVGLTADEWAEMPRLVRALANPYDGAGQLKILNTEKGILGGLGSLTPEARARYWDGVGERNMNEVMTRLNMDPEEFGKFIETFKRSPIEASIATSMKSVKGAEWASFKMLFDQHADEWLDILRRYNDPLQAGVRKSFTDMAERLGMKTDDLIRDLNHPQNAAANARRILQQGGSEFFNSEDELLSAGKYFGSADGALNDTQIMAKLRARITDDRLKWAVEHWGLEPPNGIYQFTNLIKNAQGIALLDLSAPYYLQNAIDGKLKLMREGLLVGPNKLIRGRTERMATRIWGSLDAVPKVLRQGMGAEAGEAAVGVVYQGGKVKKAPIDAITKAVTQDVSKAKGATRMIAQANEAVSGVRRGIKSVLPFNASNADAVHRFNGSMMFINKFRAGNWRAGKGFSRLAPEFEHARGDLARRIYQVVESSANQTELEAGMRKILSGKLNLNADALVDDVIRSGGYDPAVMKHDLTALGIDEFLAGIPDNADDAVVLKAFTEDLPRYIAEKKADLHKAAMRIQAQQAADATKIEGRLGIFSYTDEAMQLRQDQRFADILKLDNVWAHRGKPEFDAVYGQYARDTKGAYKRMNESIREMYRGVTDALGTDSDAAQRIIDTLQRDADGWDTFYTDTYRMTNDFLKKQKSGAWDDVGWQRLQDDLAKMYDARTVESLAIQAERDADMIASVVAHYGEAMRPVAESWLGGVRQIDADLYQRMSDFRQSVRQLPDAEARHAAWQKFWPEHKKVIAERTAANREGARKLYVEAKKVERAGNKPPPPQPAYSREDIIARANSLNPEQKQAFDRNLAMYEQAGVPVIKNGKLDDWHLIGIVNSPKYQQAGEAVQAPPPLPNLEDIVPEEETIEYVRRMFDTNIGKKRPTAADMLLNEKYLYGGEIKTYAEIVKELEELGGTERQIGLTMLSLSRQQKGDNFERFIKRLAQEIELDRLLEEREIIPAIDTTRYSYIWDVPEDTLAQRLEAWRAAHPDAKPVDPQTYRPAQPPAPDPDPIGVAPPGTLESLQEAPVAAGMNELLSLEIEPFLQRLMDRYLNAPRSVDFGKLTPDETRMIRSYFANVGGEMGDFNNAAVRYAQISMDQAMLDYTRRYGIDDVIGAVFPYQFWYTRSAINWAQTAIDRPAWFAQYHRLREMQDQLNSPQEGFPQRLQGKMQIPIPFAPEGWGTTMYVDPWHNVFGFEGQALQILRPLIRDNMNRESRAHYILEEMARNGEISEQEAAQASTSMTGALWEKAMQQAQAEVQAEIAGPLDLIGTMTSYSLPVQWALEQIGILNDRNQGGIGTYPSVSTFQNLTAFVKPGGVNLYETVQNLLGVAQDENSPNARGYLWDYYVARELSNMAAMGADVNAVKLAMIEKTGPLYEQAVDKVGKMQSVRGFASILWADFFPEGEVEQRKLRPIWEQYNAAGKQDEFFEQYPEYEARMQMNNWDDPEKMMASFLRGSIWDAWRALDKPQQKAAIEALGESFEIDFLSKETRSYDKIDLETLASWARQLNGVVPENAPETPPAVIDFPSEAVSAAYAEYQQLAQSHPGHDLLSAMYALPKGMRDAYKAAHPEIAAYEDAKAIFLTQNPDLIPYVIGEDSRLAGISEAAQIEVYAYLAERATYFPGIKNIEAGYYQLPSKGAKAAYLRNFPQLKTYWDWNREAVKDLSLQALGHVKGEEGVRKMIEGEAYEAPYRVDVKQIPPDVTDLIVTATLTGRPLGNGARAALKRMYDRERPPVGWDEWLAMIIEQFTFVPQQ